MKAQKLQSFFRTLGDANRLRILQFIGEKEVAVSEVVQEMGLSQPLVSHHLRALKERGILETRRQGPFVYYRICDSRLLEALGLFNEIASELVDDQETEPMFCCPPSMRRKVRKGKK